jgi:hypothetical protein
MNRRHQAILMLEAQSRADELKAQLVASYSTQAHGTAASRRNGLRPAPHGMSLQPDITRIVGLLLDLQLDLHRGRLIPPNVRRTTFL